MHLLSLEAFDDLRLRVLELFHFGYVREHDAVIQVKFLELDWAIRTEDVRKLLLQPHGHFTHLAVVQALLTLEEVVTRLEAELIFFGSILVFANPAIAVDLEFFELGFALNLRLVMFLLLFPTPLFELGADMVGQFVL